MTRKTVSASLLLAIAALTMAWNFSRSRATTLQKSADLDGTSWQLVKFQSGDGATLVPDDKSKYTLSFGTDARVSARIDCNRGRATWRSNQRNQLRFGPMIMTRAKCPPGSLHDRIVRDLAAIRSYVIKDGHLFLSLMADGGIYEFEPIRDTQPSIFGKRWRLAEVRGVAIGTTKAYLEFDNPTKRFNGDAGCNRIVGSFKLSGTKIKLSQGISTLRACADRDMQRIETNFKRALEEVDQFELQGDVLHLNAGDRTVLAFKADPAGSSGDTQERVIGTITYRQRSALSPDAVIEVKLVDVSRADAPAETIAEQTIKPAGRQVPIPFDLAYDFKRINPRGRYSIQVRILEGDRLQFTNTDAYLVITDGHPSEVTVVVKPVSARN
ncbi:MAG TPA: META domain-containing protein [Pyrinomonadaceae bacterium]|nr:META domain-containing protein [Pyrinomonadaceae bacterium]